MTNKKPKKDAVVNIEHHSRGNSVIDVTTRRDRFKQLYYVIHIGTKNSKNEWTNQFLLVSHKDINVLEMLIRKSCFFACSVSKSGFVSAKDISSRVPSKVGGGVVFA